MLKLVLVAAAVLIAASVARLVRIRRHATNAGTDHHIPDRLDLAHFAHASKQWLIVAFTSTSCESCHRVVAAIDRMDRDDLVTTTVELESNPDLHHHYRIDAVPTTLIADPGGTVRKSFLGPVGYEAIEHALSEATARYKSGKV